MNPIDLKFAIKLIGLQIVNNNKIPEELKPIPNQANGRRYAQFISTIVVKRVLTRFEGFQDQGDLGGLTNGDELKLFHHQNQKEKNAIAIYSDITFDSTDMYLLGFLERSIANKTMKFMRNGFSAKAIITDIECWYTSRDEFPRYDGLVKVAIFPPSMGLPFHEHLYYCLGLPKKAVEGLVAAGLDSQEKTRTASDKRLLRVKGFGKNSLNNIRNWQKS